MSMLEQEKFKVVSGAQKPGYKPPGLKSNDKTIVKDGEDSPNTKRRNKFRALLSKYSATGEVNFDQGTNNAAKMLNPDMGNGVIINTNY